MMNQRKEERRDTDMLVQQSRYTRRTPLRVLKSFCAIFRGKLKLKVITNYLVLFLRKGMSHLIVKTLQKLQPRKRRWGDGLQQI